MTDEARSDSLYRHAALTHAVTLPVLGHPVTYATNSTTVLSNIEQFYGRWRGLSPNVVSSTTFTINVVLHEGDEGGHTPGFTYRMPMAERLLITTHGSSAVVEVDRKLAFAYVTSELVQNREMLRSGMLDGMTLMLTTSVDRCFIHAAAIRTRDRLLLLTGRSGGGKSTLAYALLAAGYEVVSDDTVYVQMRPKPRLWWSGERVSLLRSAANEFAELRDIEPQLLTTGKVKLVIPLPTDSAPEPSCGVPLVCVLRHGERPNLTRLTPTEVHAMLTSHVEQGFELRPAQRATVVEWLSERGGWQLTLSSRAAAAIPLIDEVLSW